jgi:endonuclease G, mitochondrial
MDETFLLSNIAPQVGVGFNRHCVCLPALLHNLIPKVLPMLMTETSRYLCKLDWAGLEHWCRQLTSSFADVYVFTIPLYLPHKESDGKWRIVSGATSKRVRRG